MIAGLKLSKSIGFEILRTEDLSSYSFRDTSVKSYFKVFECKTCSSIKVTT